jgi:secreted Zn-dependent insulinase-like peptidase
VLPPLAVAGRIDAFVADFANELPRTPPERLRAVVASLARAKRERARRLAQQAGRYWLEVAKGDYQFSRAEEEAAALEAVRLADVVALFRERVLPGGARVRRITSLVEPRAGAAAAAAGAGVSAIDPLALRGSLGVLARPRLDEDVDGGE